MTTRASSHPFELSGSAAAFALHQQVNDTAAAYPADATLVQLFEARVAADPDAIAVVHGDRTLTYRALGNRADTLAVRLLHNGIGAGAAVAVAVRRSPELIVALLAVLKCGAAYVPIDHDWPDGWLGTRLEMCGCRAVVTDEPRELSGRVGDIPVLAVADGAREVPTAIPAAAIDADAIAYIVFTSGSTGTPKAVPIQHRSVARLVFGARYAALDRHTTLLQLAPVTFDAATFEIWGSLLHGGRCVLYPSPFVRLSELRRTLTAHGVSVVFLTTALFNTIVDEDPAVLHEVATVLTGGEAHSMRHMRAALDYLGPGRIVSVYGPTESTTFATYHPVDALREGLESIPLGRPIQNTRLYVVRDGILCGPGEIGEICLAGPGLSVGYLGRHAGSPFRTARIGTTVQRLYHTGDQGRLLDNGDLVFHGRLDDQVKVNGYRIQLGEVARHLDSCPAVKQSFVTTAARTAGENTLLAFVTPAHPGDITPEIHTHLAPRLPAYMIPTVIIRDTLPTSANGKVDKQALLAEFQDTRHIT